MSPAEPRENANTASRDSSELQRRALASIAEGRHDDALAELEMLLVLRPDDTDALNNRGCMLLEKKRFEEALESFDRLLATRPEYVAAWRNRASALTALGNPGAALESADRALALKPDFTDAVGERVRNLVLLGREPEALACLEEELKSRPASARSFRGSAANLAGAGKLAEAERILERLTAAAPGAAELWNDRGDILARMSRYRDALEAFERALEVDSGMARAALNRGIMLTNLQLYEEALEQLHEALRLKPDMVEALDSCGIASEALQHFDEALAYYDTALKIRPEFPNSHWNAALCLLRLGDFRAGWRNFEWRWYFDALGLPRRRVPGKTWSGRPSLKDKSILLFAEQGIGDMIQVVRYIPLLAAKGTEIVLEVPASMAPLMRGMTGVSRVIEYGDTLPQVDFHCALLSLPLALETTMQSIPAEVPYLAAPADRVERWRARLRDGGELLVGLVWSGNAKHANDRNRSMALVKFAPLLELPGIRFVCLQKDVRTEDAPMMAQAGLEDMSVELKDFGDTAAVISMLDLVISVDTSVVHLAGALGKPVWILLPHTADWRWLIDREDSPWYPSAQLFRQPAAGDWESPIGRMREILVRRTSPSLPNDGSGWRALGDRLLAEGRNLAAVAALEKALTQDADNPFVSNSLGNALQGASRPAEAEPYYRRALRVNPRYAEAYSNLGVALHPLGRFEEAEACHRQAIALNPGYAPAYLNLANVLRQLGRLQEAETNYRRMTELKPNDSSSYNNLANVLCELNRRAEAEECYRRALRLQTDDVDALCNLGATLRDLGRYGESEECYRSAIALNPRSDVAYSNLGNVLRDLNRLGEAEASLRRSLELNPGAALTHNNLGVLYRDLGRASDAESCFRRGLELSPRALDLHNNLANVLSDLGRPKEAEVSYRRALALQPSYPHAQSNLLFLLSYCGLATPEQYLEEAKRWELDVVPQDAREAAANKTFTRSARQGRRLRIGYVSGDFRIHAVSNFLEQILQHHDRQHFEIFAYPTTGVRDTVTERLQQNVDHWCMLAGLADGAAANLVSSQGVDVLVDLSGHTAHNRMGMFARRAAPIQCQYLGYFASTGLSTMDYLIADANLVPEQHDAQYREKIWRLPRVWVSYAGVEEGLAPVWRPSADGRVSFGSFNHLNKITDRTIQLWARLLQRMPNADLFLKTKELDDPSNRSRMIAAFAAHGIASKRIQLYGRTPDWKAHMALYNQIAVALDPVGGHGGATTTCDALWMGVPVVTLAGGRYGERMSHSILSAIGRADWSAADEEDYVEKAIKIASSPLFCAQLRSTQRETMRRTPLVNPRSLTRALEDAYETMFDRWHEQS